MGKYTGERKASFDECTLTLGKEWSVMATADTVRDCREDSG